MSHLTAPGLRRALTGAAALFIVLCGIVAPASAAPSDADGSDLWDVPNWSTTNSGATILNNGHLDIASTLDNGKFDTQVKDTTAEGEAHATHDGASWHDPSSVVMQLLPGARTAVPAGRTYSFLGATGTPLWVVSETQEPGLLWPGWSTETIPLAATRTGVKWSLDKMTGPGEFALYKGGQTLGSVDVLFNTRDGITSADSFEIPKNSHVHGSWAFSAEGTYCLGFTRSTTLVRGAKASDDFTLAVAVGRVDVKQVDPSQCFTDPGKPSDRDVTPVQQSQLTSATAGGVQVSEDGAGLRPGQLVTAQIGTAYAGQWVSLWLHAAPTWLGWAQVDASGAAQVRLPTTTALGAHQLVVKSRDGTLIGWDALKVVKAPDDGSGHGTKPTPPGKSTDVSGCKNGSTTIISAGHLDYSTQVVKGKVESYIGDNSSGTEVFREPSKTVLWLKPSSRMTLPPGYGKVGPAGSKVYLIPQTQDMDLIWLGWSTETLNSDKVSTPVDWKLTSVDGPGSVKVFLDGQFGSFGQMVFNGAGAYTIPTGVHAHANWAFSKQGIYKLHFTQSATLANGKRSADAETVTIVVGDVDPVSAVPGGKNCVGHSGGASGGADSGSRDRGDAPARHATARCTRAQALVISAGHLDWNTQVIDGKLESLIGDDSTGHRRYLQPASTVLWLKPASQVKLPAGFSQVGPAGSTVWQVPQTQNYNLIWLGWSTELLNAGNASSPVTWSLTRVDGPGSVKVYTVAPFGGIEKMVFNGTGSTTIPLGSHVHANWAFSAQGVYKLHFTQTATLAGGGRSADSEVLTIAVGNANPSTALSTARSTGSGCAASNTALTGNDGTATQAASQTQAQAAQAQTGALPGESAASSDPIRMLSHRNTTIAVLLSVLGSLLLLGSAGIGALVWRRHVWRSVLAYTSAGT